MQCIKEKRSCIFIYIYTSSDFELTRQQRTTAESVKTLVQKMARIQYVHINGGSNSWQIRFDLKAPGFKFDMKSYPGLKQQYWELGRWKRGDLQGSERSLQKSRKAWKQWIESPLDDDGGCLPPLSVKSNTPQKIKQSKQELQPKQEMVILHARDLHNSSPKHSIDRSSHGNKCD